VAKEVKTGGGTRTRSYQEEEPPRGGAQLQGQQLKYQEEKEKNLAKQQAIT
jgi:hypothetical protein